MSNIVCFIPARSGSKSIKDKNIKELGGKPLLAWSIEAAQQAGIEKIVLNSDSQHYLDIAKSYGAETMLRSSSLAGDKTSMFEVLRNEVPKITPKPDLVLLLQPTSPFRSSLHIKMAINILLQKVDKYDSVLAVNQIPSKYHPAEAIIETPTGKGMVISKLTTFKEKVASWFTGKTYVGPSLSGFPISQRLTRRQSYPQAWVPDGGIYLFKTENLNGGSIYGERVLLLEVAPSVNINSQADFDEAIKYLENKNV